ENSVVFKFLRWLGPRLAWTGLPMFAALQLARLGQTKQNYSQYARDRVLLRRALHQMRGCQDVCDQSEFTLITEPGVEVEPDALEQMIRAAGDDAAAVYSDWDYVTREGQYHSPRFTPEFSPELACQVKYWGDCYLVRNSALMKSGDNLTELRGK